MLLLTSIMTIKRMGRGELSNTVIGLRAAVVENLKILLLEIGNETILVGHGGVHRDRLAFGPEDLLLGRQMNRQRSGQKRGTNEEAGHGMGHHAGSASGITHRNSTYQLQTSKFEV